MVRVSKIRLACADRCIVSVISHGFGFLAYSWPTSDELQKIIFPTVVLTEFVGEWINCDRLLSGQLMVDYVVVEFGEMLLDTQELFQLV